MTDATPQKLVEATARTQRHDIGIFRTRNVRDYWPCRDELSFHIPRAQSLYLRALRQFII